VVKRRDGEAEEGVNQSTLERKRKREGGEEDRESE
jgi:hypothetical protein